MEMLDRSLKIKEMISLRVTEEGIETHEVVDLGMVQ